MYSHILHPNQLENYKAPKSVDYVRGRDASNGTITTEKRRVAREGFSLALEEGSDSEQSYEAMAMQSLRNIVLGPDPF